MKLQTLQAIRGLAATLVVLYHVARHVAQASPAPVLKQAFSAGHAGVDVFFVVSGFIILFVHKTDIGNPARLHAYVRSRARRIYPLYWIALAVACMIGTVANHPPAIDQVAWSASLLPSHTPPVIGVAWTLQCEMVFYGLFALLIVNRAAGCLAFTAWASLISYSAATGWAEPAASIYGLEFFMGLACAALVVSRRMAGPVWWMCGGAAGLVTAAAAETFGFISGYGLLARLLYGGATALLIAGAASLEYRRRVQLPAWTQALGQASYSIYLFHLIVVGVVWQALLRTGLVATLSSGVLFIVLVTVALAGCVAISRLIEMPLLRVMSTRKDLAFARS